MSVRGRLLPGLGILLALGALAAFSLLISSGATLAAWSNDPAVNTLVSERPQNEDLPVIARDADGSVFTAWTAWPDRCEDGVSIERIYVQKYDADGNALWPDNGVAAGRVISGSWESARLAPDGSGGVYVVVKAAYVDSNGDGDGCVDDPGEYLGIYALFAQRIDQNGNWAWLSPVQVTTISKGQSMPAAASDGQGGLIVTWFSGWPTSNTGSAVVVGAQRLNGAGNRLWGNSGRRVFEPYDPGSGLTSGEISGNTSVLGVVGDGAGGALIAFGYLPFVDPIPTTDSLRGVRIDSNGLRVAGETYLDAGAYLGEVYRDNPPDFKMVPDG